MHEIDRKTFDLVLEQKCMHAPEVREIVYAVRRIAMDNLSGVSEHPFQSPGGFGTRFKLGSRLVCEAHPKPHDRHVGVRIPKADQTSLSAAGQVFPRKDADPWVHVETVEDVAPLLRLVHLRYEELTGIRPARVASPVPPPKPRHWTPPELELVVKDYFVMLEEEAAGRAPLAGDDSALLATLQDRSPEDLELVLGQISQALLAKGLPYVDRFQPRGGTNPTVALVVSAYLDVAPTRSDLSVEIPQSQVVARPDTDFEHLDSLVEAAPQLTRSGSDGASSTRPLVTGINYADRDARSRELGLAGEEWVVRYEQHRLIKKDRADLAERVEWVARTRGDGLGYDISSFDVDGQPRLIEVKTTNLSKATPFCVTRNEAAVSAREGKRYFLYRVFAFRSNPRLYILPGVLAETCSLTPIVYTAIPRYSLE